MIKESVRDKSIIKRISVCTYLAVAIFAFFTMYYEDIVTTSGRSYLLLDSIFSGHFPEGYTFESAFYIPVHLIFAIWNIPVWILSKFGIGTAVSTFNLLWAKTLLIVCLVGISVCLKKIVGIVKSNTIKTKDLLFLFLTLFIIFCPILEIAQYDCIGLFLGTLGLLYALKYDQVKLSVKTLLLFSFASCFKLFFVFPSIIIILCCSHKLKRILRDFLVLISFPVSFFLLTFLIKSGSLNSEEMSPYFFTRLLLSNFNGGLFGVSTFFLLFFCLCFFLLIMNKEQDIKKSIKLGIWASSVFYLIFFAFVPAHPYWSVFLGFFIFLSLNCVSDEQMPFAVFIFLLIDVSLIVQQILYFDWVYLCENEFNRLFLKNLNYHLSSVNFDSFSSFLKSYLSPKGSSTTLKGVCSIFESLFIASGIFFAVLTSPWYKRKNAPLLFSDYKCEKVIDTFVLIKCFLLLLYVLLACVIKFVI